MKKSFNLLLFCLFSVVNCIAQNHQLDSLLNVFKIAKEDSNKVNILNNLFLEYEFSDEKKAKKCLDDALQLAKKIDYKKGEGTAYTLLGYFAEDKGNYAEALKKHTI